MVFSDSCQAEAHRLMQGRRMETAAEYGDVKASTGAVNQGKRAARRNAIISQSKINDNNTNANYRMALAA